MSDKKYLLVFGTRPEVLKLIPIIDECRRKGTNLQICNTGQHIDLIQPVLKFFGIEVDYNFELMSSKPNLNELTSQIIERLDGIFELNKFDGVIVHGDTITCLAASFASFLRGIPLIHVEAGLRSGNLLSPWPEEFNRRVTSLAASLHFAPTIMAKENLVGEGVKEENVFVVGNTAIDMLRMTVKTLDISKHYRRKSSPFKLLVTSHRRENFGEPLDQICEAIIELVKDKRVTVTWPVHPNPKVKAEILNKLSGIDGVELIEPQEYVKFVELMMNSDLILTDSGGMQEEAPYLSKPVLVLREETERPEVITCGAARLVGTNSNKIVSTVRLLMENSDEYEEMAMAENPFGQGYSAKKIMAILEGNANA